MELDVTHSLEVKIGYSYRNSSNSTYLSLFLYEYFSVLLYKCFSLIQYKCFTSISCPSSYHSHQSQNLVHFVIIHIDHNLVPVLLIKRIILLITMFSLNSLPFQWKSQCFGIHAPMKSVHRFYSKLLLHFSAYTNDFLWVLILTE